MTKLDDNIKKVFKPVSTFVRTAKHRFHDAAGGIRLDYSPKVKEILRKFRKQRVVGIKILRRPVQQYVKFAVDHILDMQEEIEMKGYDNVFHLAMEYELDDGTRILNEKNDVINMEVNTEKKFNKQITLNVTNKKLSILNYQNRAMKNVGNYNFFTYDPSNNNCQVYIDNILKTNGLKSAETDEFILQDIKLGEGNKYARALTDLGAYSDVLINGNDETAVV